jgi:uncharacterized protein (TIGR00725 family)
MSRRFVVGVMGQGEGASEAAIADAHELGRLIAAEGWVVLSGGRDAGVMQAVNQGAKEIAGSLTVGILPGASLESSAELDIAIVTDMGSARNNLNVLSSDVVVACGPGSSGTVSEIALALKAGKTVILLNPDPETDALFEKLGRERTVLVNSAAEAIVAIKRARQ